MYRELLEEAKTMEADLIAWRRKLHTMPELGLELPDTSTFVQEKLEEMGIPYEIKVNGSCVVGILGKGSRCFMLRSDMDGLPFQEESGEEFASRNGRMHACGHDLHATVLLGAARLLKQHESELKGQVKLLFQPGEETFQGARAAVEEGVLDHPKVDSAFAMHVAAQMSPEYVAYGSLPMAGVYGFRIILTGQGGHGSRPHLAVNPLMPAAEILLKIAAIPANRHNTFDTCVVSPCAINGGNKSNIIPETATIIGSIRSFKYGDAQKIMGVMKEIAEHTARSYGATAEVTAPKGFAAPAINNDEVAARGRALAREMGLEVITPEYPNIGSDNYADFLEAFPGFYCFIGSMKDGENITNNHHHPKFDIDESSLDASAEFMAEYAVRFLK